MNAAIDGFLLGFGLILAIGAQNAFVLRQGLMRSHVFAVCLACALSDAVLIALGVTSLAWVAALMPGLGPVLRVGGACFLLFYGLKSARAALRGGAVLDASGAGAGGLGAALLTCLALTWLNPHVYLDTVVLLGSVAAQSENASFFGAGAVAASFVFFFALGYGARLLAPVFARPSAWRALDGAVALVMWVIAASLLGDQG